MSSDGQCENRFCVAVSEVSDKPVEYHVLDYHQDLILKYNMVSKKDVRIGKAVYKINNDPSILPWKIPKFSSAKADFVSFTFTN